VNSKILNDGNTYKIGMYIRLSREDGDDLESESIGNQRSLITGYLLANGVTPTSEYVDDGYSGGNFNRPGFKKLLMDIEAKKINMVITKDLSRLGRDYIDTGNYIERIFPEKNIRYIAINDDIDTFRETSGSDMIPFRLSMNDMYAKDISKKVRSSLLTMKNDGKYCGSVPPYGYLRNPEDKYKLIIDPETAPVVKEIFNLYINGYGTNTIAHILTTAKVKTPVLREGMVGRSYKFDHPEIWKYSAVNNILKNRMYTGCLIQHTTTNINYKTKKRKAVPESEWIITPNAHEAIIDEKTFELAQSIKNTHNIYDENRRNVEYILSGLIYCKDCGSKMTIAYDKKRDRTTLNCNRYTKFTRYNFCFSHYMNYDKVEKTVLHALRELCLLYTNPKTFEKLFAKQESPIKAVEEKILYTQNKIKRLEEKMTKIYDDKFEGIITDAMYSKLMESSEEELKELTNKIEEYKKEKNEILNIDSLRTDYKQIVEEFLSMKNPTKEMMNRIIKKIYVTKDKKLEIHYNIRDFENIGYAK